MLPFAFITSTGVIQLIPPLTARGRRIRLLGLYVYMCNCLSKWPCTELLSNRKCNLTSTYLESTDGHKEAVIQPTVVDGWSGEKKNKWKRTKMLALFILHRSTSLVCWPLYYTKIWDASLISKRESPSQDDNFFFFVFSWNVLKMSLYVNGNRWRNLHKPTGALVSPCAVVLGYLY